MIATTSDWLLHVLLPSVLIVWFYRTLVFVGLLVFVLSCLIGARVGRTRVVCHMVRALGRYSIAELRFVDVNTGRLQPDMADWLLCERVRCSSSKWAASCSIIAQPNAQHRLRFGANASAHQSRCWRHVVANHLSLAPDDVQLQEDRLLCLGGLGMWLLAVDHSFRRRCSEIAHFNALRCVCEHDNSAVCKNNKKRFRGHLINATL